MTFLDQIFPFFVGHRTELIALGVTVLRLLSGFGVLPAGVVDSVQGVALPLGAATFAAKVSRLLAAQ